MEPPKLSLTDLEKEKIKLEEIYRSEVKSSFKDSPSLYDRIENPLRVFGSLFGVVAVVIGIYASVRQYKENSENERIAAAREYQKSFYEAQMEVYAEAVSATSIIATAEPSSPDYVDNRKKFLQLFWGRMSMFEDKCVEARMVEFRRLLIKFEQKDFSPEILQDPCSPARCEIDTVTQVTLKFASLRLAHQCRIYTIKTWQQEKERDSYNLIDSIGCPHK